MEGLVILGLALFVGLFIVAVIKSKSKPTSGVNETNEDKSYRLGAEAYEKVLKGEITMTKVDVDQSPEAYKKRQEDRS